MNEAYIKNVIYGVAIGDALGMPHQFKPRNSFMTHPVTNMTGFGAFNLPAGTWSDDTSMTLAALDSLNDGLNYPKMMENFVRWIENGAYTPTGYAFDIGKGTQDAISAFQKGTPPLSSGSTDETNNGNGALMRLTPIALYLAVSPHSESSTFEIIRNFTRLTHGHSRSIVASGILTNIMLQVINHPKRPILENLTNGINQARRYYDRKPVYQAELHYFSRLFNLAQLSDMSQSSIKSSGYVVDTLESVCWCLLTEPNSSKCLLKAVNLGDDTDTIASILGGLLSMNTQTNFPIDWQRQLQGQNQLNTIIKNSSNYLK